MTPGRRRALLVAHSVAMAVFGVEANAPIYVGLAASLVVFVGVSLATPPTPRHVLGAWRERLAR